MRIEMNEESAWASVCISAMLISSIGALGGCHIVESTKREAIKAGLVQKSEPGQAYPVWGKQETK